LLSPEPELLDGTGRQLREDPVEALESVEGSQYTDEGGQLRAVACLDALEGALAEASPIGKLGLSETRFDAVALDPLTQDVCDRGIRQLRFNTHDS